MNAIEKKILEFYSFKTRFEKVIKNKPSQYLTNKDINSEYPQLVSDLKQFYRQIMGIELRMTSCSSCLIDEYFRIRCFSLNQIIKKMTLLHKMKPGKVVNGLEIGEENIYYCSESPHLTNEICEKIHDKYGDKYFDLYDPDWRLNLVTADEKALQKTINEGVLEEFLELNPTPDFDNMTVKQLQEYATVNKIKLLSRRKIDIVNELKASWQ